MREDRLRELVETRARAPEAIARGGGRAPAARRRRSRTGARSSSPPTTPPRGILGAGDAPGGDGRPRATCSTACASRSRGPGVTGVLGTPDIIEDLLLLGALDGKVVFGSMNRGGLAGATWEIDDRFTAYDAATIEAMGFEGGKMLMRIDLEDPATAATVEACAAPSASWPPAGWSRWSSRS